MSSTAALRLNATAKYMQQITHSPQSQEHILSGPLQKKSADAKKFEDAKRSQCEGFLTEEGFI